MLPSALPQIRTPVPGPLSRMLAERLRAVESPNITSLSPVPPIFWAAAHGANVTDVDGNVYIDLTAGFGVANAGHANEHVAAAIARQAEVLPHALGDVYPADVKVALLERLAGLMPDPLSVTILASSGAEAVEAALKTALMKTHRPAVLAFRDAYHGLSYGALAVTHRAHFRTPFEQQLGRWVRFAPFPREDSQLEPVLAEIDALLTDDVGAIIVEPIQGRGGIVMPHAGLLAALRERCDGVTRVLVFDEIYTGCGRTGRWLACEHWGVTPDVAVLGKGLSGSLPLSACVGSPDVMAAWPQSTGEAIHTSTFLGNPIACAAALAQIGELERLGLMARALEHEAQIRAWAEREQLHVRGRGLVMGVPLENGPLTLDVCARCLEQGVILLAEGAEADVLAITPPAVITSDQLAHALAIIGNVLTRLR